MREKWVGKTIGNISVCKVPDEERLFFSFICYLWALIIYKISCTRIVWFLPLIFNDVSLSNDDEALHLWSRKFFYHKVVTVQTWVLSTKAMKGIPLCIGFVSNINIATRWPSLFACVIKPKLRCLAGFVGPTN